MFNEIIHDVRTKYFHRLGEWHEILTRQNCKVFMILHKFKCLAVVFGKMCIFLNESLLLYLAVQGLHCSYSKGNEGRMEQKIQPETIMAVSRTLLKLLFLAEYRRNWNRTDVLASLRIRERKIRKGDNKVLD